MRFNAMCAADLMLPHKDPEDAKEGAISQALKRMLSWSKADITLLFVGLTFVNVVIVAVTTHVLVERPNAGNYFNLEHIHTGILALRVACVVWFVIFMWSWRVRKRDPEGLLVFIVTYQVFAVTSVAFAVSIGWDTSPWWAASTAATASAAFIFVGARPTLYGLATNYVLLGFAWFMEAMGWLAHAPMLAERNLTTDGVALWWRLMIGLNSVIILTFSLVVIMFVTVQWRAREARVNAFNDLLKEMFGRYMSTEVMKTLLEKPHALGLGGERREASILMTDLRGFSILAERLSAEETIALLNDYFEIMVEVCFEHEGTINEIIGDALLIIFGAPTPTTDHADRAIRCALAMQLEMKTVNAQNRKLGRPEIEMGIGVNTGEVIVGNIGSFRRTKFGVVGREVNLASRIESYTTGGQVLISDRLRHACSLPLEINNTRKVHPKGARDGLTLHEVVGIGGDSPLRLPPLDESLVTLPEPVAVRFTVLTAKDSSVVGTDGHITQSSRHFARLESDVELHVLDNLKIMLEAHEGTETYAKVVEIFEDHARLRFTFLDARTQAVLLP